MNTPLLYITVTALLLVVFIHPLPYFVYQLIRWGVCIVAALYALQASGAKQAVAVVLAILFNPIAPIHLGRDTWQAVDMLAAGGFVWLARK